MKAHAAGGRAGCVQLRTARTTGTPVGVYRNDQAGLDDDGGRLPWSTVCEEHGIIVAHPTLAQARHHAPDPEGWCGDCAAADTDDDTDTDDVRTMPVPRVDIDALPLQQQMDRFSGMNPCHVCGRDLTGRTWDVVRWNGKLVAVDDWPRLDPDDPGYRGLYHVGPGCARKIPAAFKRRTKEAT